MRQIDWYFDFISPYAYLQFHQLAKLTDYANLTLKPVLFAGLLNHWGTIGPAEIPPKRRWTYQHILWQANQAGLPMRMPSSYPFNPLPLLRLALLLESRPEVVRRLFGFIWEEGHTPQDTVALQALLEELQIQPEQLNAAELKHKLQAHSEQAVAAGVFGVPSAVVDGQLFWGVDSQPMLLAYLQNDPYFQSAEFLQADATPLGVQRPAALRK